jgi:sterol desaturase/sphingolipid hydroxylase (fatty acid hydroxylase superfamily)
MSNLFGLVNGKLIGEPPLYVDKTKRPGASEVPRPTILGWIQKAPLILITSPNFVWALMALGIYHYNPYPMNITSPLTYDFMTQRLQLWIPTVLGYFSFWYTSLYTFNLGRRPFITDRKSNYNKLAHNIFWTTSGICIWTAFENIFCYLWSTGRLHYSEDYLSFFISLMAIPLWRSFHFYFAHRFLHFTPLYQQVHSLHHRNTDIEPFSGLCMHPVEHLYYYSCILPSLVFVCSPFALLWNGVHLLLSPAASHSGWEDHFQSDVFHYMHHRYFECNYAGTDAAFLDIWFGTFRGSIPETESLTHREDAKSTLATIPSQEFVSYLVLSGVCCFSSALIQNQILTSILAGFGPVLLAVLLSEKKQVVEGTQMGLLGNLVHISIGSLFCSVPIAYMNYLSNSKIESFYTPL